MTVPTFRGGCIDQSVSRRARAARLMALLAFCVSLLAGCGGSADAPPPPDTASGPTAVAPTITLQPSDVTVMAPSAATYSAAASGTPAPAVQWQSSNDAGTTWTAVAGATNTTFTTPATAAADSGEMFRAVFSNIAGSATTTRAKLTVTTASGTAGLSLIAGNIGSLGTLDGTSIGARFHNPNGIAIDTGGNLYVADTGNQLIRKITPAGVVSTLAGQPGVSGGADGPGAQATFSSPTGVAVDAGGNIYVADFKGPTIRKITPDGVVSTLAGSFGMSGYLVDGPGAQARFAAPFGITVDPSGTIYVTDQIPEDGPPGGAVRSIQPSGYVTTIYSTDAEELLGIVARGTGDVYVSAIDLNDRFYLPQDSLIYELNGDVNLIVGGAVGTADGTASNAQFNYANGLALDSSGMLYVADSCNDTVRRVAVNPVQVTTLAGNTTADPDTEDCFSTNNSADGTGTAAVFNQPTGTAVDSAGNVYVVDSTTSVIRKVTPQGVVTTFAGAAFQTGSSDGPGNLATFAFTTFDFSGPAVVTGHGATAIDASGNVFVADTLNQEIRKISADGQVSTFAGSSEVFGNSDGVAAAASFAQPVGIAVDSSGNLYVSDDSGNVIRKITPGGVVTTLAGTASQVGSTDGVGGAARFSAPMGIAVDSAGNVYVADQQNFSIRKITPAGVVSTLAGSAAVNDERDGTGAAAAFSGAIGIALDSTGTLYVSDLANTIRKVTPLGVVTTIAGTPGQAGSVDGAGASALFNGPTSIAVDASGNVYVADTGNDTVRKITPAGVVSTLIGVAGEDGVRLGTDARLDMPFGLSISGNELVLISAGAVLRYTLP